MATTNSTDAVQTDGVTPDDSIFNDLDFVEIDQAWLDRAVERLSNRPKADTVYTAVARN